jgi:hypothetical protein
MQTQLLIEKSKYFPGLMNMIQRDRTKYLVTRPTTITPNLDATLTYEYVDGAFSNISFSCQMFTFSHEDIGAILKSLIDKYGMGFLFDFYSLITELYDFEMDSYEFKYFLIATLLLTGKTLTKLSILTIESRDVKHPLLIEARKVFKLMKIG